MLKLLINKLKKNLKNLKELENDTKKTRMCDKCGVEKPLNTENYQVVKYFRDGFSYYCNECNKPKPKE